MAAAALVGPAFQAVGAAAVGAAVAGAAVVGAVGLPQTQQGRQPCGVPERRHYPCSPQCRYRCWPLAPPCPLIARWIARCGSLPSTFLESSPIQTSRLKKLLLWVELEVVEMRRTVQCLPGWQPRPQCGPGCWQPRPQRLQLVRSSAHRKERAYQSGLKLLLWGELEVVEMLPAVQCLLGWQPRPQCVPGCWQPRRPQRLQLVRSSSYRTDRESGQTPHCYSVDAARDCLSYRVRLQTLPYEV